MEGGASPRSLSSGNNKILNADPVVLDFAALADDAAKLDDLLERAFGNNPSALGLILVENIPNYPALRQNLLPLATCLSQLPDEIKAKYEDAESSYNVGWSCGREKLANGTPDTNKASFYANPACDRPTEDPRLLQAYPEYCRPNVWPKEVPALEGAFKALGQLICYVGMLLTAKINGLLLRKGLAAASSLPEVLARSISHKGRLLCYLPAVPDSRSSVEGSEAPAQQWCGWHLDHGALTGLTSAMYTKSAGGAPEGCEDPQSGLHIKNRNGDLVRVKIPEDKLAFQLGECFQIMSGGQLRATPHAVVAPRPALCGGLHRNTFALFMQPKWDEQMNAPPGTDVGMEGWKPGMTFGEYAKMRFSDYY